MVITHASYLVPVSIDRDGSLLVRCGVDAITGAPSRPTYLAMWCPDCRSVVTEIVPGSEGVDIDSDGPLLEQMMRTEATLAHEHVAAVADLYRRLGVVDPEFIPS